MNFIDDYEQQNNGWEQKLDTASTKVWAKKGGSQWDKTNPMVKCTVEFKETTEPKHIFEAVSVITLWFTLLTVLCV